MISKLSKHSKYWIAVAVATLVAAPAIADQPKDGYITTKVKMKMLTGDMSSPFQIDVDTLDGVVTLGGRVESEASRDEAEQTALSVKGVRDVRNMLAVIPGAHQKQIAESDRQLEKRLETVLDRDYALEHSDIRVKSVHGGNVILAGRATNIAAHQRALEDVRSVDGVVRVASEIESESGTRFADEQVRLEIPRRSFATATSDGWITTKVKFQLIRKPGIAPLAMNVDTHSGIVTLFGTVSTEDGRREAGLQAMKVDGVKTVENELQVVSKTAENRIEKRDDQIRDSLQDHIESREALGDDNIEVEVANGVVRLTGSVDRTWDHMTAVSIARSTLGVRSVVDDLRVEHKG